MVSPPQHPAPELFPMRRPLSALLVGAVLLTGCSLGAADEPVAAGSPSPDLNVGATFRAAAADTDAAASSRYTLTTATTVNGTEVVFSGEGIYDWATDTGQTTYDVPVGKVLQRLLGPDLYLALPQQPEVYFKLKTADVATSPVGGTIDPSAQLHLLAAVEQAEVVGEEEVRGEPTTHYRGTYDVARALRGARGVQQPALRSLLGVAATADEASYDVFLDEQGLLRRLQQTVEVPASTATAGQELTVTTTLELYDFGIEVTVRPPAGADVRDGAPLLAALRAALPKPSPQPSPAASPGASASAPAPTPSS
jgi:hypothetical protein